jgi:hypothetical protein
MPEDPREKTFECHPRDSIIYIYVDHANINNLNVDNANSAVSRQRHEDGTNVAATCSDALRMTLSSTYMDNLTLMFDKKGAVPATAGYSATYWPLIYDPRQQCLAVFA